MDFGANVKAYVGMFMRNLDWKGIQTRYEDAAKVEPLRPWSSPSSAMCRASAWRK